MHSCEPPVSEAFEWLDATVRMPTAGGCASGVLDEREDSRLGPRSCPHHHPHLPGPSQLSPSHRAETVHCRLPSLPPLSLCCHVCLTIMPITIQASDSCLHARSVAEKFAPCNVYMNLPRGHLTRLWPISLWSAPCVNVALSVAAALLNRPNMFCRTMRTESQVIAAAWQRQLC